MKKFANLKSVPACLPIANIDTDMIIPAQFLKTIKRTGLGKHLFSTMRYDESGNINNMSQARFIVILYIFCKTNKDLRQP